ncbi:MAG: type I-B CRISPR-associated protein Cas5b [Nitrososphaerales archaeon]
MKIKLLVFDIKGFFAHFRKPFSTTSSLSYSFPPRTTVVGVIAAIMGYDRDSYYKVFSSEKCRIALQVKSPVRHVTNTLNYLMTDKPLTLKKLRGIEGPMPVHVDMLVSSERWPAMLHFRVFFNHDDEKLLNGVAEQIRSCRFAYPPYLGTANNIAEVEYVDFVDAEVYRVSGEIEAHTLLRVSALTRAYPQHERKIYLEDLVPADFAEDRRLRRGENYIYEGGGRPLRVMVDCEVFRCTLNGERIVGVFM